MADQPSSSSGSLAPAWQRTYAGTARRQPPAQRAALPAAAERAGMDAGAAWLRFHDPRVAARFGPQEWPWFALLERARVETLASRDLPGMAANLADLPAIQPQGQKSAALYRRARRIFGGQALHSGDNGRAWLGDTHPVDRCFEPGLPRRPWFLFWRRTGPAASFVAGAEIDETLDHASHALEDAAGFAERVQPLVKKLARHGSAELASEHSACIQGDGHVPSRPDADATTDRQADRQKGAREPAGSPASATIGPARAGYTVYSTQWDEEVIAASLCTPEDGLLLQRMGETDRRHMRRLANRLQRQLQASQQRQWLFDQECGRLDSRRLARLVIPGANAHVFRTEQEAPVPEACVTLLLDQSGSMGGRPQELAVLAVALCVQTLERCQVRSEVLGYTTIGGADNPVARAWKAAGSPPRPGRLNATRHVIYKTASQPWRSIRASLGLMLRPGFGRENIDGEALRWAARRLLRRPEQRKVLIVLSDGAPYDAATAAENGRAYLEEHLRTVIHDLERSPVHLAAIGAGFSVARYYRNALTLLRPEAVAETLFQHLAERLVQRKAPGDPP